MQGYTKLDTFRYERKFVLEHSSRGNVEAVIRQNSAFFTRAYLPRQINNIYFDTPGLSCYFDNLFGNGERWKARIRWYNDCFGKAVSPILEFKIKKGLTGTKLSFPLSPFNIDKNNFNALDLKDLLSKSELPDQLKGKMVAMQPVLLNSYRRSYFATINKKFRITVDTDLTYYSLRPTWNQFQYAYKEAGKVVVELKYDMEHNGEAASISNQFPFRLDKNSKYVAGMSHFRSEIAH